ncbi:MAG: tRNA-dihydrouridine synthase family protein [Victivallaceae bacterium]|nr:tRNA-dihydrouridine synthase family protein [Victivallaceae bacterium]
MNQKSRYSFLPGPMEGAMTPEAIATLTRLDVCDEWITPFLRVSENCPKERILREFLAPFLLEKGKLVTVQLMGGNALLLAKTAEKLLNCGATAIDLNFGCPSGTVLSHGAGGALLRTPTAIREIVQTLAEAVGEEQLSAKIRGGFSDFETEIEPILEALLAPKGKLRRIVLHYRSVREGYQKIPGAIPRFQKALTFTGSTALIANGEIFTEEAANHLLTALPSLGGIMCARGLFRDPFLLRRLEGRKNLPAREEAGEMLYRGVFAIAPDFPPGKAIELGNLIWGGKNANPHFQEQAARFNRPY